METEDKERTPYLRVIKESIGFATEKQAGLFDACELEWGHKFLNTLPELAQCLLARMILRQTVWLRTDRLENAMPRDISPSEVLKELHDSLSELQSQGFVEFISDSSPFGDIWEAVNDTLLLEDLKRLYVDIVKSRPKGGRDYILDALHKTVSTTKDLFNRPLNLARHVRRLLQSPSSSQHVRLVRVTPVVVLAFRRFQRVVQISSSGSGVLSGRDIISVSQPLRFNAPMLVMFNKIRYPKYSIKTTCPIFPSKKFFRAWEGANELRACINEATGMVNQYPWARGIVQRTEQERDLLPTAVQKRRMDGIIARCIAAASEFDCADFDSSSTLINLTESNTTLEMQPSSVMRDLLDQFSSTNNPPSSRSLVTAICLGAAVCLLAHINTDCYTDSSMRPPFLIDLDGGTILCSLLWDSIDALEKEAKAAVEYPHDTLRHFPRYAIPIAVLRVLLYGTSESSESGPVALRYCTRRRGKYYGRICIDLEHAGMPHAALDECKRGLLDSAVKGSYIVGLMKRETRLKQKCSKLGKRRLVSPLPGIEELISALSNRVGSPVLTDELSSTTFKQEWPCSACTLLNIYTAKRCVLCGCERASFSFSSVSHSASSLTLKQEVCVIDDDFKDENQKVLQGGGKRRRCDVSSGDRKISPPRVLASSVNLSDEQHIITGKSLPLSTANVNVVAWSDVEIDDKAFGLRCETHLYCPDTVVIIGRRLGDMRAGKNLLVGLSGDAVSVERLVMETMRSTYERGILFRVNEDGDFIPADEMKNFCGGWVGWHDEGGILRALYTLMMWSEIFECEVEDVFQTPFQDSPLDLYADGALFYLNRRDLIDEKLQWIESASNVDLIELIGNTYRNQFRRRCVGISWGSRSLRVLQLCAISLGGVKLASLFRAMSADYKQFSSGAPDLLMIRAISTPSTDNEEMDWNLILGEGWDATCPTYYEDYDLMDLSAGGNIAEKSEVAGEECSGGENDSVIGEPDEAQADYVDSRPDRFLCMDEDLALPAHPQESQGSSWRYDCMLVEVKGPTDRLSDTQQRWIHILNSLDIKAVVCRVREGKVMGSCGGHHKTVA